MSEEVATPVVCSNCGRTEVRPAVRICPNCGAVLPGLTGGRTSHAGFAALAQMLPPEKTKIVSKKEEPSEPSDNTSQPWVIHQTPVPVLRSNFDTLEDDQSGPYLTQSLWGDRVIGFAGEVTAVALGIGTLVATGEAANHPNVPDWAPAVVLLGGIALFSLFMWQAKRLRDTYPQLARGWYSGRSVWENTILPFIVGSIVVGMILLILGPLGLLAICLGSVFVLALGPLAWLVLAMIVFVIGRLILYAIRQKRNR